MVLCNPLLLTLLTLFSTSLILVSSNDLQTTMKLHMIHRHAPLFNKATRVKPLPERVRDLIHRDKLRSEMISGRRGGYSIRERLMPGRDYGIGEYIVPLRFGTPAKQMLLIVDTGSDLTWIKCNTRSTNRPAYRPNVSSSFENVPCSSQSCKVDLLNMQSLPNNCPTRNTPCAYNYSYLSGSNAQGSFAKETITVGLTNGKRLELRNVLIGCTNKYQGDVFNQVDGVLGLGFNNNTFTLKASQQFGGKFSYCLVDHLSHRNRYNYLVFGHSSIHRLSNVRRTKLDLDLVHPFYAVNVLGISIGYSLLKIPVAAWDPEFGSATIVDSGTSLTFLTEPAYKLVMAGLVPPLSRFKKVTVPGVPLEFCFSSTGYRESVVPKLTIHFRDGARFEPHVKSYVIDVADGVKCIGFASTNFPGFNVIGNILQQNFFWEFDLVEKKLAFGSSKCR